MDKKDFQKLLERQIGMREAAVLDSTVNVEERSVETVLVTENAAVVIDWKAIRENGWRNIVYIREVLLCDEENVELPSDRSVPFLDSHWKYGGSDSVKGSIRDLKTDSRKVTGRTFVSSTEETLWIKIKERHLRNVSAGYEINNEKSRVIKPGETLKIQGREFNNNYGDGLDLVIREKWKLLEGSSVVFGADEFAKHRSKFIADDEEINNNLLIRLTGTEKKLEETEQRISLLIKEQNKMPEGKTPEQILEAERSRVETIENDAARVADRVPNVDKLKRQAIKEGWELPRFQTELYNRMLSSDKPLETPATHLGLSPNDVKSFSITRAMQSVLNGKWGKEKSFESEISEEIRSKLNHEARSNEPIFIPHDVLIAHPDMETQKRALNVSPNSAGGFLVGTEHLGKNFIEILREESVLMQLGIQVMPGLRSNIQIPKQLSESVFQWVGTGAADQSFMTFTQVTASPKTGSVTTEYGRQLILQGDPGIDVLVNADLFSVAGLGVDKAGLSGTGDNNEPLGLLNETGVGGIDLTTFNWAKVVSFLKKIKKAKASKLGAMKWLMSPEVEELCLITPKVDTQAIYLMNDDGKMAGLGSKVSNQSGFDKLILGIWTQMMLLEWGVLELFVNPYGVNSRAGNVEVTAFVSVDYVVRQAGAFTVGDDVPVLSED